MDGSVGASNRSARRFGDKEEAIIAAVRELYALAPESIIAVYDIRDPNAERRMYREQAGWRGFADVVVLLGVGYAALVMWPGGARRLLG